VSPGAGRRGAVLLASVIVMALLLALLGMSASQGLSSSRRAADHSQALRLRDLVVANACEEVCAALEAALPPVPAPTGPRDLGATPGPGGQPLTSKCALPADLAAAGGAALGVSLTGPVTVRSSSWIVKDGIEMGMLELELPVRMTSRAGAAAWTVRVRRSIWVQGDDRLAFHISTQDMAQEVISR